MVAKTNKKKELLTLYYKNIVDIEKQGPPGPPPRPGLEWNSQSHRWVRPKTEMTGVDVSPAAFAEVHRSSTFLADRAREAYNDYFNDQSSANAKKVGDSIRIMTNQMSGEPSRPLMDRAVKNGLGKIIEQRMELGEEGVRRETAKIANQMDNKSLVRAYISARNRAMKSGANWSRYDQADSLMRTISRRMTK